MVSRRGFVAGALASAVTSVSVRASATTLATCGALTIDRAADGRIELYGWANVSPNPTPRFPLRGAPRGGVLPEFVLTVSFADKLLECHRRTVSGWYEPALPHVLPVVTPDRNKLSKVIHGWLYRVETEPSWAPSERVRAIYSRYRQEHPEEQLLPLPRQSVIPYGHPTNAMGERKLRFDWHGDYDAAAVLHGTTGYPITMCETETSGCVRLYNPLIINLSDHVLGGQSAIGAGVEMILTSGPLFG